MTCERKPHQTEKTKTMLKRTQRGLTNLNRCIAVFAVFRCICCIGCIGCIDCIGCIGCVGCIERIRRAGRAERLGSSRTINSVTLGELGPCGCAFLALLTIDQGRLVSPELLPLTCSTASKIHGYRSLKRHKRKVLDILIDRIDQRSSSK